MMIDQHDEKCVNHIEQVATKLIFWQALTLTFLGEWGDRSQITTIALAIEGNPYLVFIGAFLVIILDFYAIDALLAFI